MNRQQALLCAITGAALWGLIGLFVNHLYTIGFTPWETVAIRVIFSALLLVCFLCIFQPSYLKIKIKDLPFFIGTGIVSIVLFNWCYFTVMEEASLSLAVTLLYTGPLFVTLLSRFLFKEYLTKRKVLAVVFTIFGCAFTVGLLPAFDTNLSLGIIVVGIGSGFFYALYSIFGKYISTAYSSLTITVYSFICAGVLMVPVGGLMDKTDLLWRGDTLVTAIGLALIPTALAYVLYTNGLKYMESSRASILTTIEPVVAIITGVLVFNDHLSRWQLLGVMLVLSSLFLIATKSKAPSTSPEYNKLPD